MNTIKNTPLALVTGASRGIGRAIAETLAGAGYDLVLTCSRTLPELSGLANSLEEKYGIHCTAQMADASDPVAMDQLFASLDHLDVLVNNAGISHIGLFTDMTPAEWNHVLDVNLGSVLNCTHLAVPAMVSEKDGVILNISSMWGEVGASCEAVYSASKGGINAFTKAMAKELGPSHIRVNAISCGVIDTEMNACFSEDERQALADEIPLMRFGQPEEVAELAVFLADRRASFLTGKIITLDGGML